MSKRTLVTSALPYANGPIHLGHLAGAYLPADLYVRYKRLIGDDVVYICGSDEHGVPITIAADKEGVTPQDIVDRYHQANKAVFARIGISFDYYGRTSSAVHHEVSSSIFKTIHDKGFFRKKTEKQLYDPQAGKFLADRYVKGTCPKCGYAEAYGDQCEKCGTSLSPSELIDPKSMLTGAAPELRETEHWYLPLGEFQPEIESWLNTRENWKPNVMGQCRSWLTTGLTDRAVTRDLNWGVPVPLEDAQGKVLYVWFDAPIGYISATKEWAESINQPDLWKTYWMDEETDLIHFIGKDNIVFHCIMFPATLMKHGGFVLPKNVPANEFLNLEGQKLSTSRGWAVWLHDYLDAFEPDMLRYALGTTLPENKDSDFSWKDFQTRVNSELADILGNFVFRTLSFTDRFFDGTVPELTNPSQEDEAALAEIEKTRTAVADAYERFHLRDAIAQTMNLARAGNKYLTDTEPWKTRKSDIAACANSIHVCLQITAALSVLFEPLLPFSMSRLRSYLNLTSFNWQGISSQMLTPGTRVISGEILYKKVDDDQILTQIQNLEAASSASRPQVEKPYADVVSEATFEEFQKLDLRTGLVLSAENVPKSKKLLKLNVDLGFEIRQVMSGIAEYFSPEQIINKKVVVVANLKPRKIMGEESKGMILMANNRDGSLSLVESDGEPGSQIN
jgi:methionyl-tRNA synthetase